MRDVQRGDAVLALHALEQCGEVVAEFLVERGERFVEEEDLRLRSERASEGDALAFATGEALRAAVEEMR